MSSPNEKLAAALKELHALQKDGARVVLSKDLGRTARERLLKHGFVQEALPGWLIAANGAGTGDTTPWFASFWEFCSKYCDDRFGDAWHLSPEQSLLLHAEHTNVPHQIVIYSPSANNSRVGLMFGTSMLALKQASETPLQDVELKSGVRVLRLGPALVRADEAFFKNYPIEARVVLGTIEDPSEVLAVLLAGGHSVVAGRLSGAFRHVGKGAVADEILSTMKAADFDVREMDPFRDRMVVAPTQRAAPPIVERLSVLWHTARPSVLDAASRAPTLQLDHQSYLARVDDVYVDDAYHSLSIEGYQVTPELIARVASGEWDTNNRADMESADALAAKGYWLAFQKVRNNAEQLLRGTKTRAVLRTAHREWYRELFAPHVAAGLLPAGQLAGYRNGFVYIRGSRHIPPRSEAARDAMPALFDLLEGEAEPLVRAVLGHWLLGYIHPFIDGNGRIARFLMNALLAEAALPWTVIRVEAREKYMEALETASTKFNLKPFASFLLEQMTIEPATTQRTKSRKTRRS